MLRVLAVLLLLAIYISFVVDVVRTPAATTRAIPKLLWLLIVIVLPLVGGVLWFVFGRPLGTRRANRHPVAPDDDPRFLKELDDQAWRERMRRRRDESPDE